MSGLNIALVGATGAVGRTLLKLLEKAEFAINELLLYASERSSGRRIDFRGTEILVEELTSESFIGVDIAFFCAGSSVSKHYVPLAVEAGAIVIDSSSLYRLDPDVPLIIPEINPEDIYAHRGIIANPNCSTIIMLMAIKPLMALSPVKRIVFATYQAVSGVGHQAISELESQVRAYAEGREPIAEYLPVFGAEKYYPIAFNLIPQVDVFADEFYTKEEWKMIDESHKILKSAIPITGTCVRVPVFWCHSEALNVEFESPVTREEAHRALEAFPGVKLKDNPEEQLYPQPLDYYSDDNIYVGRVREDNSVANGLNLWVVGNQLHKGAATNALQIAELLIKYKLLNTKEE